MPLRICFVGIDFWRPLIWHTDVALLALPKFEGKLYRGINCRFDESSYKAGETVCWPSFSRFAPELPSVVRIQGVRGHPCVRELRPVQGDRTWLPGAVVNPVTGDRTKGLWTELGGCETRAVGEAPAAGLPAPPAPQAPGTAAAGAAAGAEVHRLPCCERTVCANDRHPKPPRMVAKWQILAIFDSF